MLPGGHHEQTIQSRRPGDAPGRRRNDSRSMAVELGRRYAVIYICAWCKEALPATQANGDDWESHGICVPWALGMLPKEDHEEFLEGRMKI